MSRKEKTKMCECSYSHCKHESRMLLRENAIRTSNKFFHPDCYHEMRNIKTIKELYRDHFEAEPIWTQLINIIKDIIYNRKVDSDFFVFAMDYAIANDIAVKHPPGLYYLVKNEGAIKEWEKQKNKELQEVIKTQTIDEKEEVSFVYKPKKQKTIADILGD